jgi:hypothetical protein
VLQVDGYAGYRALAERGEVQLAFCWSNVRLRFYELAAAGPAPIASEAMARRYLRPLRRRGGNSRLGGRGAPDRPTRAKPTPHRVDVALAIRRLETISQKGKLAEAISLRLLPLGWTGPLPLGRPHRTRLQHRRTCHPPHRP